MKKMIVILAWVLITAHVYPQKISGSVTPSLYYTSGTYSNTMTSSGYDAFTSLGLTGGDYLIAGFSTMNIDSSTWKYGQKTIILGAFGNYYPFYLKANYGFVSGTYERKDVQYTYDDNIDIFNASAIYNWDLFYFGIHGSYVNGTGYKNIQSVQVGLRTDWLLSPTMSFSIDPLYSYISDGRKLYSIGGEFVVVPFPSFKIQASGSVGRRAYYFNPELLTIFNQDQTQSLLWGGRIEYGIWGPISLVGSYQSTKFTGYTIQYATAGIKGFFTF